MFVDPEHPEKTKERLRNGEGKFVSANTPVEDTAVKSAKSDGPIQIVKEALTDPSLDKPLLAITVNNPFRKILQWIKEIKKKQTTTFEFKIKVPLIALPVFMVVLGSAFTFFFNLGKTAEQQNIKSSPTPSPIVSQISVATSGAVLTSKVGLVKGTYQVLALMAQTDITLTPTPTQMPTSTPTNTPTPSSTPTPPLSRFVLLDKDERITFLITITSIKMENYLNKRVLITGMYEASKNTLTIKRLQDIEILP